MKCPRCANQLQQVTEQNVTLDVCANGCGGVWFDNFEIKKFDEPHEPASDKLIKIERDSSVSVNLEEKLNCPKCENMPMMRHFFSVKRKVEVDECPQCAGIWLDAGELGQMRTLFESEEQRNKAFDEYFDDLFADELAADLAQNQQKLDRTKKVANVFRFICPTNYIPGKQNYGAF